MTVRTIKKTFVRNRQAMDPSVPRKQTSAVIAEITAESETTMRLTFNDRVLPARVPGFTAGADGRATVESMTAISDTEIELEFSDDVQGTAMTVPEGDAGLRTPAGGFVPAGSYDLPEFP